jgi:hypothetical protein
MHAGRLGTGYGRRTQTYDRQRSRGGTQEHTSKRAKNTMEMTTEELGQASRALAELMKESRPFRLGTRVAAGGAADRARRAGRGGAGARHRGAPRPPRRAGRARAGRDAAGEVQPRARWSSPTRRPAHAELDTLRRTRVKVQVEPLTPGGLPRSRGRTWRPGCCWPGRADRRRPRGAVVSAPHHRGPVAADHTPRWRMR